MIDLFTKFDEKWYEIVSEPVNLDNRLLFVVAIERHTNIVKRINIGDIDNLYHYSDIPAGAGFDYYEKAKEEVDLQPRY